MVTAVESIYRFTYRFRYTRDKLLHLRERSSGSRILRSQPRFQTNGVILRTCSGLVSDREMPSPRPKRRVFTFFLNWCRRWLTTFPSPNRAKLFVRLGVVTVASFIALFLPFLPPFSPLSAIMDPITRIFPFNRGIFEDKVANFWCASNVLMKWKFKASAATLVRISTLLTALGFAPAVGAAIASWMRLGTPSQSRTQISAVIDEDNNKDAKAKLDTAVAVPTTMQPVLLHALLTSAMSFFLFSFQVHEKTILVPLMPLTLLMSAAPQDSTGFKVGALANNVGVFR